VLNAMFFRIKVFGRPRMGRNSRLIIREADGQDGLNLWLHSVFLLGFFVPRSVMGEDVIFESRLCKNIAMVGVSNERKCRNSAQKYRRRI